MIVATAGHVDHGKTALVRQLTGIDTDSLEEEKRRGLSINLGFAYRPLGERATLGFVDVPGHSRFINTMISGVAGIDLGMLVVAADDGIMPQTLEHLDVLRLLGLRDFIAVITKIDRVDAQRVEEVTTGVRGLLADQKVDRLFPISNHSGEGIDALRSYLDRRALAHQQRAPTGYFRLSIDRAFLLKGAGLVLTGTAAAGSIAQGDKLRLLPADITVRVRSLHADNHAATSSRAGQRCALNVAGTLEKNQVARGDTVTNDMNIAMCERFDGTIALLPTAPFALKHLSPVTLHIGAKRLSARLYLLDKGAGPSLQPGQSALAQLILEQPIACWRGDRFLIRDDSESFTLGGGMVVDPLAPRSGKARADRLNYLEAMRKATPEAALQSLLQNCDRPVNVDQFSAAWNLRRDERDALMDKLSLKCFEIDQQDFALATGAIEPIRASLLATVQQWLYAHPGERGIRPATLQETVRTAAPGGLFRTLLTDLLKSRQLELAAGLIRLPGYTPTLSSAEQDSWCQLRDQLQGRALKLPLVSELVQATGLEKRQVLASLALAVRQGRLIKLNADRYALPEHMQEHAAILSSLAGARGNITIAEYKKRIDSGRRLTIEILEYFDDMRFTKRLGEARVILDAKLPDKLYNT